MERFLIADFSCSSDTDKSIFAFMENTENHRYAREPVIAKMKNGTLVCIFLSGGPTEPDNSNVVFYKKSYDDGKNWTNAELLFSNSSHGVWGTEIFTGFEHPMMVISMYDGTCPFKMLQTFISWSYDNGETWSYPEMVAPLISGASIRRGFTMSNGEVLFPIYYTVAPHCFDWNIKMANNPGFWIGTHHECAVAVTNDGKTFSRFGRIANGDISLWEPNCVELEPGHIVMLIRQDESGKMGMCESLDFGRTWGDYHLTDIPNAGSKITAFKVNGKVGIIGNYARDRRCLKLCITKDFKTFEKTISIDNDELLFFYPHAIVDEDTKTLYISYENGQKHYLARLSFEEAGLL